MGSMSIWHWLIVLLVVVMVFGTKKLKNVGRDLGDAVRGFKEGVNGDTERTPPAQLGEPGAAPNRSSTDGTIDVPARDTSHSQNHH